MREHFIRPIIEAFPDIHHKIDEFIVEDDRIAKRYRGSGTHEREFGGKPETRKRMNYADITIFRLKDEKIHEVWNYSICSGAFDTL